MIEASFRIVSDGKGELGERRVMLLAHMFGKEIVNWQELVFSRHKTDDPRGRWKKGDVKHQPDYARGHGWHNWNLILRLFPNRTEVEVIANSFCGVRPTEGPLEGLKIWEPEAIQAAIGELGLRWFSQQAGIPLKLPDISKAARYSQFDSCMKCQYRRQIRMGSDEMELDFSDTDGRNLRDLERWDGAYQPQHICSLFNTFLEVQWDMLWELNRISEGGMVRGQLVNIAAGFDSERHEIEHTDKRIINGKEIVTKRKEKVGLGWININTLVEKELDTRACNFHRESKRPVLRRGDTTHVIHAKERSHIKRLLSPTGSFPKKVWVDLVPVGWMPKAMGGILVPGGVVMVCDEINWEASNVQRSMPTGQKQLQNRLESPADTGEHVVPADECGARAIRFAELI